MALIAPAFAFDRKVFEEGRAALESRYGVKTKMLDGVYEKHAYFAGDDDRRLDELYHWLTDPETSAVFAIRGGYGCARIYPRLAARLRKRRGLKPKIVMGYSDLTILLNGLMRDFGWVTFHGPVVASRVMREPLALEEETFRRALFSEEPLGAVSDPGTVVLAKGRARGRIVGGCLSLVASSIGTPYQIETRDRIVFLEDVTEKPYRLDRMLTHLIHSGLLDRARGIVFGQMTDCGPPEEALEAVRLAVGPYLAKRGIPAIYDFPAGHGKPQITFPIGAEVELDARADPIVRFLEAGARGPKK